MSDYGYYGDYSDKDEEIRRLENQNNTQRQQLNAKIRKLEQEKQTLADNYNAKCGEIARLRQSSVHELKTMKTMIDNLLDDKIRILEHNLGPQMPPAIPTPESAKIPLKIGSFSDRFVKQYSERVLVKNVFWRIAACINERVDDDTEYLGFKLECEDVSQRSFKVSAELRLISTDEHDYGYYCRRYYDRIFDRNNREWGYDDYMEYAIITDECNGYIVDDSIILEIAFTVQ